MRTQGIEAKHALEILRPQIKQLSQDEQAEIVRQVRSIENHTDEARQPTNSPSQRDKPFIKPISKPVARHDPKTLSKLARTLPVSDSLSEFETIPLYANTRKLGEYDNSRDSFFGSESMLVLAIRGSNVSFKVRPQKHTHALVIGRGDQTTMPDIDLTEFGAASLGVSRMHVTLHYDSKSASLAVTDMNTVNGTFINGVKLLPQEVRVLRHGDELRLGQMVLVAHFYFAED
jgi:hypothetical protein